MHILSDLNRFRHTAHKTLLMMEDSLDKEIRKTDG